MPPPSYARRWMQTKIDQVDRRVLCLYVGGTVGMSLTDRGFAPEPGLLTHLLRDNPKFNDRSKESVEAGGVMPLVRARSLLLFCDVSFSIGVFNTVSMGEEGSLDCSRVRDINWFVWGVFFFWSYLAVFVNPFHTTPFFLILNR